ncbi:hypothetical protein [Marinibactrum halimedae]|uniref:Uncharacterized protein n=1 Tax=Marinibactrum halimedae TaxID=1444977 RepID=A0AA37WN74_9GAMM|nr:hypothetical protein [Marinibactrum halimedae]MCD9459081.1 hypothetical protein [Marinibactrum halimedae]GLS24682.1 hypothetical protein GCM10007877_03960 [Marinibactrum halimedae]
MTPAKHGVLDVAANMVLENPVDTQVNTNSELHVYFFLAKDDLYYVKRSGRDTVFTIGKSDYEKVAEINLQALVANKEDTNGAADNTAEPSELSDLSS